MSNPKAKSWPQVLLILFPCCTYIWNVVHMAFPCFTTLHREFRFILKQCSYLPIISAATSIAAMGVILYVTLECPHIDTTRFKWVPLVEMLVCIIVFCLGLGIASTFVLTALFSASIKGKGLCRVTISNALLQCITTKLFQVLEVNFGIYTAFTLFAAASFVISFLVDYFMPDTKEKTLEEIQRGLKQSKKMTSADFGNV